MRKRFASIWIHHLLADWQVTCRPGLRGVPFVFAVNTQGRMVITAVSPAAEKQGIVVGMVVADAKAFFPALEVIAERPRLVEKLLRAIGLWCIQFTPIVGVDGSDGLLLDISGCTHLWGGESAYRECIIEKFAARGYHIRMAIADTIGTAWAIARFGTEIPAVESGGQLHALWPLPPEALRLTQTVQGRLQRLGFRSIGSFATIKRTVLRRRFGEILLLRLGQALGEEEEFIVPLTPPVPYAERLPCLEPICTDNGIVIALQRLLGLLCRRLSGEGKGFREGLLKCLRVDGKMEQIGIATSKATVHVEHLLNLFSLKIPQIEPALGIELFILEASRVEDADAVQEAMWSNRSGLDNPAVSELLDRLKSRTDRCDIVRYLPDQHYWPERSMRKTASVTEKGIEALLSDRPRPLRLLPVPEQILVTAPIPDYPPMLFRYRGVAYAVKKADGPERIEREWWIDKGEHRDYYCIEDDKGRRYWIYRSGHYGGTPASRWFLHGFFA